MLVDAGAGAAIGGWGVENVDAEAEVAIGGWRGGWTLGPECLSKVK